MFIVGITGGIGSGKSRTADIFRKRGVLVLDADAISREVTETNGAALPKIKELLGPFYFDDGGELNRQKVASLVFSDKSLLDTYSRIIHDEVFRYINLKLEKEKENGTKLVVLDVPIPVKKDFLDICDHVLVVSCDESIRLSRLMQRGMEEKDAQRRMDMQMSNEEYEALGEFILDNSGDLSRLETQVNTYIKDELEKRGMRI